ncbi:hypothetical protein [Scytonema sp. NUACC21]
MVLDPELLKPINRDELMNLSSSEYQICLSRLANVLEKEVAYLEHPHLLSLSAMF